MKPIREIPGRSYEWDDERLLSVEWTEHERLVGVDPGRLENVYDADGHRIESTETQNGESTTTQYLVDESGWLSHVVAEIRDGEIVTHYQRAGDQLLGLVREGSAADRYFHLDGLGSVRGLTDASGSVTDRYEYTAYGERLEEGTDPQPYGFTGEPWSSVMELAHHRARWMDPAMGRFLSVDPLHGSRSDPRTQNHYLYSQASPITRVDPAGLRSLGSSLGAAAVAGIVSSITVPIVSSTLGFTVSFGETLTASLAAVALTLAAGAAPIAALIVAITGVFGALALRETVMSRPHVSESQRRVVDGLMVLSLVTLAFASSQSGTTASQTRSLTASRSVTRIPKGRLTIEAGEFSVSEVRAAQHLSSSGRNVRLRQPVGTRAGGRTSDLVVDGVNYDVFTPRTANPNRIISAIAKKNSQAEGIVLDLSETSVTRAELGNILARVRGAGALNIREIVVIGE